MREFRITFSNKQNFLKSLELLGGTLHDPGWRMKSEVEFEEKVIEFRYKSDYEEFMAVLKKNDLK